MSSSKSSRFAELFVMYRTENNHLLTKFINIKSYLEKLVKIDDIEKKDIVGSIFSLDTRLGNIFDNVELNSERIIDIVNKLIKCLEDEKKLLDNYMSKLKHSVDESHSEIEKFLINYNNEQYDYMQQLNTLIPDVIELFDRAIGMEDETIEHVAKYMIGTYSKLERALVEKVPSDHLYVVFEDTLFKLKQYGKYLGDIVKHLTKPENHNSKLFFENFMHSKGDVIITKLEKIRSEIGRDKDNNLLYSYNPDKKEDIDKFFKESLELFFKNIKIKVDDKDVEAKNRIAEIIKIDKGEKELEDNYKKLFAELQNAIDKTGLRFSEFSKSEKKKSGIDAWSMVARDGKSILLKNLFDSKTSEDNKYYILRTLENALSGNDLLTKNKTFKAILEENSDLFSNYDDIVGKSDDGNSDLNNYDDNKLNKLKDEILRNAKVFAFFIKVANAGNINEDKFEDYLNQLSSACSYFENFEKDSKKRINYFILLNKKLFNKNLNSESVELFYSLLSDLKDFISENKNNYSENNLQIILDRTLSILNQLKLFNFFSNIADFINNA